MGHKATTPDAGMPKQTWCPIKDGVPRERVTNVLEVIDYRPDEDDSDEDFDEDRDYE